MEVDWKMGDWHEGLVARNPCVVCPQVGVRVRNRGKELGLLVAKY